MAIKKKKRRSFKNCQHYNSFDEKITCDNPAIRKCICINICKYYELYVEPYKEQYN